MAKGNSAKTRVVKKIKEAFGKDFIAEVDKKLYVWADDDGERVQIAISLTCPKVQIETGETTNMFSNSYGYDFEAMDSAPAAPVADITPDEKENIANLLAKLGL